jgi:hypothetical protein
LHLPAVGDAFQAGRAVALPRLVEHRGAGLPGHGEVRSRELLFTTTTSATRSAGISDEDVANAVLLVERRDDDHNFGLFQGGK